MYMYLCVFRVDQTITPSLTSPSTPSQISRITEASLGQVPGEFRPLVRGMLAVEPNVRPDAVQISKVSH